MNRLLWGWMLALVCGWASVSLADEPFTRQEDVVYGRKPGVALTLDVFTPKEKPNGLGIIYMVSGGWYSNHEGIAGLVGTMRQYTSRGYTVFAVVHGSQPKFAIPEIVQDIHRAVRFVRHNAKKYNIDPDKLGITGGSAGGHLSMMIGTSGTAGDPKAKDPVDRESSRVQAVACFYPPTDFLNYGKPGEDAIGRGTLVNYAGAFDFREYDPKLKKFVNVTDEAKIVEIGKQISPITHVTADDPPTLIAHGDKDFLVPFQQGESIIEKLKAAGVKTKLITKPGAAHGWPNQNKEVEQFIAWFDEHLAGKVKVETKPEDPAPVEGKPADDSKVPVSKP